VAWESLVQMLKLEQRGETGHLQNLKTKDNTLRPKWDGTWDYSSGANIDLVRAWW
jgi:hypothetical protein